MVPHDLGASDVEDDEVLVGYGAQVSVADLFFAQIW